jgi:hypothetical protein
VEALQKINARAAEAVAAEAAGNSRRVLELGGAVYCPVDGCGRPGSRVTRYPISISRMTISILSSPIALAHIPYRYPG